MANEQNLKSFGERTASERREIAKKAGRASGEKRRHQRDLREAVKALQGIVLPVKGEGDGLTYAEAIVRAVGVKAAKGDLKAAALFWEWVYGKTQKVDVTSSDGSMSPQKFDLGDRSIDELMALVDRMQNGRAGTPGS